MTDTIYPLNFNWDGDFMIPLSPARADRQYVVGEVYRLAPHEERSHRSHAHYFASVTEVWRNLPEHMTDRFPTADHLRKWALIRTGHCNSESIVLPTKKAAQEVAAFTRRREEFAVVTVVDFTVTVYTAMSQSYRAMGKKRFQQSKDDVLDLLSTVIGVETAQLQANTGAAA